MKNYMISENGIKSTLLKMDSKKANLYSQRDVGDVSERFLYFSAMLPEKEVIGFQISADADGAPQGRVFSSPGINVTTEDFDWVFKNFGTLDSSESGKVDELWEESRKVYVLTSIKGSPKDTDRMQRNECYYDDEEVYIPDYFPDMFAMLMEEKAVISIIAGAAENNASGHGMILIGLPGEMSLRMRTMISFAFPHVTAEDAGSSCKDKQIPDESFWNGMTNFLYAMIRVKSGKELRQSGISDDSLLYDESGERCFDEDVDEDKHGMENDNESKTMAPLQAKSYMEMLNELIGLEGVKEQVRKIAAFARMKKNMVAKGNDKLSMAFNMEFVGNPGTAKTTVARIVAGIFHEVGLLSADGLVEVGRADLVARYVGQTATKVKEVFKRAKGKVLFIDEAYSLVEIWEGEFGDEAINTIVQEMENNREDTVVIFAGYPDKMEDFFSRNPGLRSRVPFCINFKDYSTEEMLRIAELEAQRRGFSIDGNAKEKVLSICETASGKKESGNGRFCRNLIENAILSYATRIYGNNDEGEEGDCILTCEDFEMPESLNKSKTAIPMGFHA